MSTHWQFSRSYLAVACLLVFVGETSAASDVSRVYKCRDTNGAVLYTDDPCSSGTAIDIHPGQADPDASQRLRRAQAELDRAAIVRKTSEDRAAAISRDASFRGAFAPPPDDGVATAAPYDVWYGGWYPTDVHRRVKPVSRAARLEHGRIDNVPVKRGGHESRVPAVIRNPRVPH